MNTKMTPKKLRETLAETKQRLPKGYAIVKRKTPLKKKK